mmetsp:Transcript_2609/g.3980  ORF Transcript_2609/g.3980 Transcript_2609/m.3980 type:complete len:661 (+) Transcript_2609:626-2608(+)
MEDVKEHRKQLLKMHTDRPKVYALILQYISEESLDEIKRSDKWEDIEKQTDPLELWLLIEETHKVNSISKVEEITKLAARTTYNSIRQGPYESIITFKERFNSAHEAYIAQGNPKLEDKDIAMDFFRALDNARYGTFKMNYKKELELAFGDYCEVYDGTTNTSASRSIPCIALYPNSNSTGSWEFMNLMTKQRVRRSNWKLMVTTQLIVDVMIFFEEKKNPEIPQEVQQPEQEATLQVLAQPPENVEAGAPVEPEVEEAQDVQITAEGEIVSSDVQEAEVEPPDLVDAPDYDSDDGEEDEEDESDEEENEPETGTASRTRPQTGAPMNPPPRYTMASVKINKKRENKDEIELLFVDLRGVVPEFKENIKGPVYRCHMFEVEKFLATGDHDKFKSRLVFDGSEQDPSLFPDRSSPTVALHSLMACLALAASNGMTKIGKIDVKEAFIQTEMVGPPVYIKCDPGLTRLIVEVLPAIKKYVTAEGTLYCRLLKALYGCVKASNLWYNKLTAFLRSLGYEHSPTDPCVLRKIVDGKVYLLMIYVDDILVFAEDEAEVMRIKEAFVTEYQWITMEVSDAHSYLGMQIMLRDGAALIDMTNFVEKLLLTCGEENLREFTSPATKDLFNVSDQAIALTEQEKEEIPHQCGKATLFNETRSTGRANSG